MVIAALMAGVLGGVWWLVRGGRRARRLYRRWRWRDSIVVFGLYEPGRAWQADAVLAAVLAIGGPLLSEDIEASRAWRGVWVVVTFVWLVAGAPPLDRVWH